MQPSNLFGRLIFADSLMEHLLSSLADLNRKFQAHGDMNITDEEANAIVERVVDMVGLPRSRPTEVALTPVFTYVDRLNKTHKKSSSIVVPPFACHWGIVVGPPAIQTLFHLLFVENVGPNAESSTVENRQIRFHYRPWEGPLANATFVGQTRYELGQLVALGQAMIQEFGSYHRLFWNCQTFAKCYLRVITDYPAAKFDNWTSADTTRLFLCAFLVGAPFATTNKVKETIQAKRLIRKIESIPKNLTAAEDESAETIMTIYEVLKQDPSWGSNVGPVEDTSDEPGFLSRLWKFLFE